MIFVFNGIKFKFVAARTIDGSKAAREVCHHYHTDGSFHTDWFAIVAVPGYPMPPEPTVGMPEGSVAIAIKVQKDG